MLILLQNFLANGKLWSRCSHVEHRIIELNIKEDQNAISFKKDTYLYEFISLMVLNIIENVGKLSKSFLNPVNLMKPLHLTPYTLNSSEYLLYATYKTQFIDK